MTYYQHSSSSLFHACRQLMNHVLCLGIKKVKLSRYRPGQALRVPRGWGSRISRQSAHEGGNVVSPTQPAVFTPRKDSWYSFLLEAESTPGPQCDRKDCHWKIPVTPSGIEPATFRLVAQCLNQLRHRVPRLKEFTNLKWMNISHWRNLKFL
jgi:hypothetical protein